MHFEAIRWSILKTSNILGFSEIDVKNLFWPPRGQPSPSPSQKLQSFRGLANLFRVPILPVWVEYALFNPFGLNRPYLNRLDLVLLFEPLVWRNFALYSFTPLPQVQNLENVCSYTIHFTRSPFGSSPATLVFSFLCCMPAQNHAVDLTYPPDV